MKYLLLILILVSCNVLKQDTRNIDKAAVRHPELLAKKARILFPCVTTKGDTIYFSDSAAYMDALNELQGDNFKLYQAQDSLLKALDSLKQDTLCFALVDIYTQIIGNLKKDNLALHEKIKHIPPIIKTVEIHDSIVDDAAVAACEFEKSQLIAVIKPLTDERNKYKKRSRTYLWILIAVGAILGVGTYIKIAGIFKPKKILP